MPPVQLSGRRRAVTLLELLVVLVLLGLSAAVVLPTLRLPGIAPAESALARARTLAVRRGEAVRLETSRDGSWIVRTAATPDGPVLLSGSGTSADTASVAPSVLVSALGTCFPEGAAAPGQAAWDPARCALTPP
ncbi:MAG: GspH/FimT family pseudopilin [Gemmatimonadota bacterium]